MASFAARRGMHGRAPLSRVLGPATLGALAALAIGCAPKQTPSTSAGPLAPTAFLEGAWLSEDGETEEHWITPRGGTMLGVNRTVIDGRTVHHEFILIQAEDGEVVYRAFPQGQPPASFALERHGEGEAVFANPRHDFPQRIHYRLVGDTLEAEVSGVEAGEPRQASWRFRRLRSVR
jgi:Domain of unknown function (DUF6265)